MWGAVYVAAMTALVAFFFRDGLFGDDLTLIWDGADYHFPTLNLVSRLWRSGHLPLWNPFLFNGYPLFAQPHYQVFYPPNLLITLATAFTPRVVYLQVVLHLLLGGMFTTLLAGFWMRSWPARILAGVVYALNGYTWNHFEHDAIINTAAWLPFVLYALERAWRRWTAGSFALAVASIALLILAGPPSNLLLQLAHRGGERGVLVAGSARRRSGRRQGQESLASRLGPGRPRPRSPCSSARCSWCRRSSSCSCRIAAARCPTRSRWPPER